MPPTSAEPLVLAGCALLGALLILRAARRASTSAAAPKSDAGEKKVFASMVSESPASTVAAIARDRWLPLRHKAAARAIEPAVLESAFEAIRGAFSPQQVDYSNTAYGKDHWKLSCFMQYSNGVAASRINLAAGAPMFEACAGILGLCDEIFLPWWETLHPRPRGATRELVRLQSFVTRYRPSPDETHLPRHIDGANVDGSLVLGLPTYSAFGDSGGLTVWDGENEAEEFVYPVAAGDVCLLDSRVWHQSNPISHGERWVIVIFYEVLTTKADGTVVKATYAGDSLKAKRAERVAASAESDAGEKAAARGQAVRGLLAKRVKDAAKRREVSANNKLVLPPSKGEAAWQGG